MCSLKKKEFGDKGLPDPIDTSARPRCDLRPPLKVQQKREIFPPFGATEVVEGSVASAECSSGIASSMMGSGQSPVLALVAMTLLYQVHCALEKKETRYYIADKSTCEFLGDS